MRRNDVALWLCGSLITCLSAPAGAQQTITFSHYFNPVQAEQVRSLLDDFEAETGVEVETIVFTSRNVVERLQVMAASGTFPDVLRLGSEFTNLLPFEPFVDLNPFIAREGIDLSTFYPAAVEAFTIVQRRLAMPTTLSTYALFYNADQFDAAGIAEPPHDWSAPDWDWNTFMQVAARLTVHGDAMSEGPDRYAIQDLGHAWMWPWWWGGDWLDPEAGRSLADTPATILAMERLADLHLGLRAVGGRFTDATAASIISGNWSVSAYINADLPFDWDLAPTPAGTQRRVILYPNGVFMGRLTDHQDAAWALIRYLSTNLEVAAEMSRIVGRIPSQRSLATRYVDLQESLRSGIDYQVLIDALAFAQYPSTRRIPQAIEVERLINSYWSEVRSGGISPQEAGGNLARAMAAVLGSR